MVIAEKSWNKQVLWLYASHKKNSNIPFKACPTKCKMVHLQSRGGGK
jgi:hypothetical protein